MGLGKALVKDFLCFLLRFLAFSLEYPFFVRFSLLGNALA